MALGKSALEVVEEDRTGLLGIAPHWCRVRLGDIASVLNGFPFDSARFTTGNGTPLVRIRDLVRGSTTTYFDGEFDDRYLIEQGDLLVGMDGDFNLARWRSARALLNQRVCKIDVRGDAYAPGLIDHALPVYLAAINAQTSSVTVKHLSSRTVEEMPLPLPPRGEQERLVDRLDELLGELDNAGTELRIARRKLFLYRQALLKSAVEGTLTADWRIASNDVKWSVAALGELAEVGTGVTPLRSDARYFEGGDVPWVTSGALNAPMVKAATEFVTAVALKECRLRIYPAGSLLVAMYGEGKTRGKCSELAIDATVNQAIAALVLRPQFAHCRDYLKAFLWHSYESMRKEASGGVQPNLNLQIIKNIRVPLPPPSE